ncbi:hypothetical protein FQN54_002375 [Arachnomyces sp. PD_36]|nr:hypothetical protein FQN54_002375 [Arachnomyces sp. PD_36]
MADNLLPLLDTSLALLDQFYQTLSSTPTASNQTSQPQSDGNADSAKSPSPLPLLSSSATLLKSQVTKLSLLAINSPFTPSAAVSVISAINESVLPSLVTASLLITPETFTRPFHAEANVLVKTAIRELKALLGGVKTIAVTGGKNIDERQKEALTGSTGRIWDSCDTLVEISQKGIIAVVVKKTEEFRDTVKDAIRELEEWDPEDDDDGFDDLLGEEDDLDEGPTPKDEEDDEEKDIEALQDQKKHALRILKSISQIYPAIISNRLRKTTISSEPSSPPPPHIRKINDLTANLQKIPDIIDEAVGALYESNVKCASKFVDEASKRAVKALEISAFSWNKEVEGAEDKFVVWARTWIKVVDEVEKSKGS